MTGLQEHPGTGKKLDHLPAGKTVSLEDTCRAMGVDQVVIVDPAREIEGFEKAVVDALASNDLTVVIARRPCILAMTRDAKFERGEKVR